MPNDWEGYPLRKDYEEQETYHGIKVAYWVYGFQVLGFQVLGFQVLGFQVLEFRVLSLGFKN
jgi:hypothetical protein